MRDVELLLEWERWMEAQGRAEGTIRRYRYVLHRLSAEVRPPKDLVEMTETDIVAFLASLGKRSHAKHFYMRALRSLYTWAHRHGYVESDPTEHLRPKAPPTREPDAYSPEEVASLVAAANAKSPRYGLAILVAYGLGLRRSEVCKLEPDDVDWEGRRVHIRDSKGGKSRWVEMSEVAEMALVQACATTLNECHTIFGMDPQWFTMIVNRAARDAGLPPRRRKSHMLRAAYATHLLSSGAPVSVVSRLLGHSNIAVTARYLAVNEAAKREAVAKLPALA